MVASSEARFTSDVVLVKSSIRADFKTNDPQGVVLVARDAEAHAPDARPPLARCTEARASQPKQAHVYDQPVRSQISAYV